MRGVQKAAASNYGGMRGIRRIAWALYWSAVKKWQQSTETHIHVKKVMIVKSYDNTSKTYFTNRNIISLL